MVTAHSIAGASSGNLLRASVMRLWGGVLDEISDVKDAVSREVTSANSWVSKTPSVTAGRHLNSNVLAQRYASTIWTRSMREPMSWTDSSCRYVGNGASF